MTDFFCECDDARCTDSLDLTLGEMLDVRAACPPQDGLYIVRAGHEAGETVVLAGASMSGFRYSVVRGSDRLGKQIEAKQQP